MLQSEKECLAYVPILKALLDEAAKILQKVSLKSNWFNNIKNMLPGSDLSKIKDINDKIIKQI